MVHCQKRNQSKVLGGGGSIRSLGKIPDTAAGGGTNENIYSVGLGSSGGQNQYSIRGVNHYLEIPYTLAGNPIVLSEIPEKFVEILLFQWKSRTPFW